MNCNKQTEHKVSKYVTRNTEDIMLKEYKITVIIDL